MTVYARASSRLKTPQSQPIPGRSQMKNEAGGYVFALDAWAHLERFLILGTEGGTYYVTEKELTRKAVSAIEALIAQDGPRVVRTAVEVSQSGRAPRNTAAVWAIAACGVLGDEATRKAANDAMPHVCRTGTHLFQWADAVVQLGSRFGPSQRRALRAWYQREDFSRVLYQLTKYRQREAWTHRDLLRLSHLKPRDPAEDAAFAWVCGKPVKEGLPEYLRAFDALQAAESLDAVLGLITEHNFSHEMIPSQWHKEPKLWQTLVERDMPLGALTRNLGRMAAVGATKPLSDTSARVVAALSDGETIRKARLHPVSILNALAVYQTGHGQRGSLSWTPDQQVLGALESAFYLAFQYVEPTGKRTLLAVDHSGSMQSAKCHGFEALSVVDGAAAMMLATARVEARHHIIGFANVEPVAVKLSVKSSLQEARQVFRAGGGTDCSLPFQYATKHGIEVDVFVIYTDNQTWSGDVHVCQALTQYRQRSGIAAKAIAVSMAASDGSLLDPKDAGSLDVAGFDATVPALVAGFSA